MPKERLLCFARVASILIALSAARAQFTPAPAGGIPPVGANPVAMAVGDFNGDLIPDLAIADINGNITVLLGNGLGGFTAPSDPTVKLGYIPSAIAVGSFNGDQFLDLAVTSLNNNTVTVLTGDGKGGLTIGTPITVGSNPSAIAVGDFNGDKIPDLAIANEGDGTVTVLLGAKGGFMPEPPFAAGTAPVSLAIADLNLDGNPDIAIANLDSNNITVLLGDGSGGFTADTSSPFAVPAVPQGDAPAQASPISLVIFDVNNDGYPDLITANEAANNITVLLGNAQEGFTAAPGSPFSAGVGMEPVSLATGDFNSDGITDLAIVNYKDGNVTVLLGNGQAGFTLASGSPYPVGVSPRSVVAGDFNGDGKPDLAIVNEASSTVSLLLNTFPALVTVSAASGVLPVAPGSIVSIYGTGLAAAGTQATALPLPTELGGTSVTITYSDKSQASLPLFYAGPAQVNALIPQDAVAGVELLTAFTASGSQSGPVVISTVAPGLFSANETGEGVAAAQIITPMANGFQNVADVFTCSGGPATCIAASLDVSGGDSVLVLYGTGLYNATMANTLVNIGDVSICPSYVGPTSFAGEDQVNVTIPKSLAGVGQVHVTVTVTAAPLRACPLPASLAGTILVSNSVTVYFQ
jgi:uncharacterized protein (TIGR03437 family)